MIGYKSIEEMTLKDCYDILKQKEKHLDIEEVKARYEGLVSEMKKQESIDMDACRSIADIDAFIKKYKALAPEYEAQYIDEAHRRKDQFVEGAFQREMDNQQIMQQRKKWKRLIAFSMVLAVSVVLAIVFISIYGNHKDVIIEVNGVSFVMKTVNGGRFMMGSNQRSNEKPIHEVTLIDYYIGETEVTQALWEAVMGQTQRQLCTNDYGIGYNYPVYGVSYEEIVEGFIPKLNQLTGKEFRLPSEAEWEFAARGGNRSKGYQYAGSDILRDVAHAGADKWWKSAEPVKTKEKNELGLFDMSGNVWEICGDAWSDYSSLPQNNPRVAGNSESDRVVRGGASDSEILWSDCKECKVTYRDRISYDGVGGSIGFRLALSK